MKKLIILLLFLPFSLFAQKVLKHTLIPIGQGAGTDVTVTKVTDYRLLFTDSRGLMCNFTFLGADGDTIKSFSRNAIFRTIAKVNDQGVIAGINFNSGWATIRGFTMDSNGVLIDTFRHYFANRTQRYVTYFLDSYTDSNGNVVLHTYASVGLGATYNVVCHYTLNQFGQLVKYKEYGPNGLNGSLVEGSKLLVKDGKLWGFTSVVSDGVIGLGIDTAGFTGQSYYLMKTNMSSGYISYIRPYKRNGYFIRVGRGSLLKTCKSEIMGKPVLIDSLSTSGRIFDLWANSDSSRILIYDPSTTSRKTLYRVDHLGNTLGSITPARDTINNSVGFFCFGDGSWITIGQNPNFQTQALNPYMLTRISDMGYPYDPWKQQVVFKGVTGTAKEQDRPTILAYPNPTQDRLKFLGMAEGNVRLIDATGKELLNQSLTEEGISLAHLPRGLYRYLVTYRGKYYQGKVVRE